MCISIFQQFWGAEQPLSGPKKNRLAKILHVRFAMIQNKAGFWPHCQICSLFRFPFGLVNIRSCRSQNPQSVKGVTTPALRQSRKQERLAGPKAHWRFSFPCSYYNLFVKIKRYFRQMQIHMPLKEILQRSPVFPNGNILQNQYNRY